MTLFFFTMFMLGLRSTIIQAYTLHKGSQPYETAIDPLELTGDKGPVVEIADAFLKSCACAVCLCVRLFCMFSKLTILSSFKRLRVFFQ